MTSSILKDTFHNTIADSVYKEAMTGVAKYYYYLGRTTPWLNDLSPETPVESVAYDRAIRNDIIMVKEIKPTEISYVSRRIDWVQGEVYDEYDDQYSTEVQGIDLINGGSGYSIAPKVYIGSTEAQTWQPNTIYEGLELLSIDGRYYIVDVGGISGDQSPLHTSGIVSNGSTRLRSVLVSDGNGFGATAVCSVFDGFIIDVQVINRGFGYTAHPSVIFAGSSGSGAEARSVITFGSKTNAQRLENTDSYVMTDEFYVYQCLHNNNGAASTVKPTGTSPNPFKTSDGYIWKLLYMIPVSMRNRFVTSTYIPVVSALSNQFYSAGSIQNISLINRGSDYTSATISITGDGHLESNPYYLIGANIIAGGTNYTSSPTISIQPPFSGAQLWSSGGLVSVGSKVRHLNKIYEVVKSGSLGTTAPTHREKNIANGTTTLTYVGEIPTATVTVVGGEVTDFTLYGDIAEINVLSGGSGYINRPNVYITGGGGSGATAIATIDNGSVQNIIISNSGDDFTTIPSITIGDQWQASQSVNVNDQYFYGDNLYTVTVAGTTGSTPPTHTIGSASNGTATFEYAGKRATATARIKFGAGYSFSPTVEITDGSFTESAIVKIQSVKSEARLVPIIQDGEIVAVNIVDGGIGYTYAVLGVTGDGEDAELVANLSIGDINSLQSTIELLTVDGQIVNIPIVSSGYGYGNATVIIDGDGTGATAEAVVNNGRIVKINVTNYGQGYRNARIIINGNGYGAKARAVLSPYGGFGKQAIKALNARTLMFVSNVFLDTNRGFALDNDYRQVGIIKGLKKYESTLSLTQQLATPCWVLDSQVDLTNFNTDDIITNANGDRFKIVSKAQRSMLVSSLDNAKPSVGNILSLGVSSFIVTAVTAPNVDKYSGDMLFVDNKFAFVPSSEQRVTLRTVIEF